MLPLCWQWWLTSIAFFASPTWNSASIQNHCLPALAAVYTFLHNSMITLPTNNVMYRRWGLQALYISWLTPSSAEKAPATAAFLSGLGFCGLQPSLLQALQQSGDDTNASSNSTGKQLSGQLCVLLRCTRSLCPSNCRQDSFFRAKSVCYSMQMLVIHAMRNLKATTC